MTKEEYNKVRTSKDFLYEYFVKESKVDIDQHNFNELLNIWLLTFVGAPPHIGRDTIIRHLDSLQRN